MEQALLWFMCVTTPLPHTGTCGLAVAVVSAGGKEAWKWIQV